MTEEDDAALRDAILEALSMIIDPEIGGNIVDLGLVYDVRILRGRHADVTMTTTTRGCPAAGYLRDAVRECARNVPGVENAEVHLTYEPPWSPEMMNKARPGQASV